MDTSGESGLSIVLSLVVLASGLQVAFRLPPTNRRFPVVAVVLTALIGIPSLLQIALPQITDALSRRPSLELDGQWWRVLTALMTQDGGVAGAIFNLVVVAVVTVLGERVWGRWRMLVLFVVPSIVLNLLAVVWNAPGGGSSFASDGLLLSMCALGVLSIRRRLFAICTAVPVAAGIVLIVANDAHGVAMLLGTLLGTLFWLQGRTRHSRDPEPVQGAQPG